MTGKERVKSAIAFKEVDRVPAAILDGGVWIAEHAGMSFEDLLALEDGGAQIVYDAYEKLQSDLVFTGGGCFGMALRAIGAVGNFSQMGKSAEVKPLADTPEYFKDFDVSSIREKLLADKGIQGILRQTENLRKLVGQDKYISTITGAPMSYAGQMIGVQNLMIELFDEDSELDALFNVAVEVCAQYNNILIEAGADMVCLGDPVASGALISQDMYEEFALPLLKRAIGKIQGAEQILLHICGDTTARLNSLVDAGINVFSLDTVDLATALEISKGHYAIMGNLSPFDVMTSMKADEVKALGIERCNIAGKNGGFILAPGCDLPNATPIENVWALSEATL